MFELIINLSSDTNESEYQAGYALTQPRSQGLLKPGKRPWERGCAFTATRNKYGFRRTFRNS